MSYLSSELSVQREALMNIISGTNSIISDSLSKYKALQYTNKQFCFAENDNSLVVSYKSIV